MSTGFVRWVLESPDMAVWNPTGFRWGSVLSNLPVKQVATRRSPVPVISQFGGPSKLQLQWLMVVLGFRICCSWLSILWLNSHSSLISCINCGPYPLALCWRVSSAYRNWMTIDYCSLSLLYPNTSDFPPLQCPKHARKQQVQFPALSGAAAAFGITGAISKPGAP